MSNFMWDRDEMIAHSVHLQALVEDMGGWSNPGVGEPDDYGNLVGSQVVGALKPLGDTLFSAADTLRSVTVARLNGVRATAEAYTNNESANRELARRMTRAMGVE